MLVIHPRPLIGHHASRTKAGTSYRADDLRASFAIITLTLRSEDTMSLPPQHVLQRFIVGMMHSAWVFAVLCLGAGCQQAARSTHPEPTASAVADPLQSDVDTSGFLAHAGANDHPTAAYRWIDTIEEVAARRVVREGAKPTIISRDMAIAVTAMYDAWAAYDEVAVGTRLGGSLRRPAEERTTEHQETAIAYAVFHALSWLYPEDTEWLALQMKQMGYDPEQRSSDAATPIGIGIRVADALIAYRRNDGANQFGDEGGGAGKPYADYTGYHPVNAPDHITDPDRWQPITFVNPAGGTITPGFLTPQWFRVKPLGMERADQFRLPGPPPAASAQLRAQADQVLAYNASLTLRQKALVEFMRDGPRSTGQSGHWLLFAQDVSRRDHNDLGKDVRLFFCIANVCFDGFIACWESKRFYDSSRPWTLIHYYYKGVPIRGWAGPCKGVATMPGEEWHPYSPETFITPPFPGFPSGHATVSGASSRMLALFTGSDRFGVVERRRAGVLTEPGCDAPLMQSVDGHELAGIPASEIETLALPTFSATARLAALSRALGGYHIPYDNDQGLIMGQNIADYCWPHYQAYFTGSAHPRP
jgi:hypothetical protein